MNEFFILPIEKLLAYQWGITQVIERHKYNPVTKQSMNDAREEIKGVCLACGFPEWFNLDVTFYQDNVYVTSSNKMTVEASKVITSRLFRETGQSDPFFADPEEN